MKQYLYIFSLFLIFGFSVPPAYSQDSSNSSIRVTAIEIATSIHDRMPEGAGSSFSTSVKRLFCYTKISGVTASTKILHVWYYKGKNMAEIELSVYSDGFRTFSSKNILPFWKGEWRVDVLTTGRKKLASKTFTIQN